MKTKVNLTKQGLMKQGYRTTNRPNRQNDIQTIPKTWREVIIVVNCNVDVKFYQRAAEVTRSFVPGLGIPIFTNTYVVHKSIAVDKAFA